MKVNEKFKALNGKETDPRTRRYLAPRRVVLTEGDVRDPETLLRERSNQITLVTGENCTLRNQPGKPHAKILLDFGIEFAGSVRLMIWARRDQTTARISTSGSANRSWRHSPPSAKRTPPTTTPSATA